MAEPGLVTLGETMGLLRAAEVGPLRHGRHLSIGMAGAESNVSIGTRRLGVAATWIGRVGDDEFGDLIERELRAEDVTALVTRDGSAPTGLMIKERRTADRVHVTYYRTNSAGSRLGPDDLDETVIRSAGVLHVTGITLALGTRPAAAVDSAVEIARSAGVPVSLDVNYRSALWSAAEARAGLTDVARRADIVFAGDAEAELLVDADGSDPLPRIAALGPTQVVLKQGERGAVALIDGERLHQPAIPVSVIDPVGAGDAFVAGYLAGLLEGRPPRPRLEVAAIAGAYAVSGSGDWESLPRDSELALLGTAENVRR